MIDGFFFYLFSLPVESLVYWRDVQKSGVVFGAGLALLLAISLFSVISVIAYASLIVLLGTVSFRVYKIVLQTIQKTSDGHPFKWVSPPRPPPNACFTIFSNIITFSISFCRDYLDAELILPEEKVTQAATVSVAHVNAFLAELRRLFLVEDFVDSAKFGLLLWVLTYLGSWFNGITLAVIGNWNGNSAEKKFELEMITKCWYFNCSLRGAFHPAKGLRK